MKNIENKIYKLSDNIETLQRELRTEKERVIKEIVTVHAKALFKELQEHPIEEFTLRDIEQYFKGIAWDIRDTYKS